MGSIHKKPKSKYWMCSFKLPDGRWTLRSTKVAWKGKDAKDTQEQRERALKICLEYEQATRDAVQGRLAEGQAREIIGRIYQIANTESLPQSTVKEYLEGWLKSKEVSLAETSLKEYKTAVKELMEFLGDKVNRHIDTISLRELTAFRDSLAERVTGATVNKYLKILAGVWRAALKDGLLRDNVFNRVEQAKTNKSNRRAFTMDELKNVLKACGESEWRGIVLVGLYTGMRLGKVCDLTWREVDLQAGELRTFTNKTEKAHAVPIAKPLLDYLLALPAVDDPDLPIFPQAAELASQTRSNHFHEILVKAGLVKARTHKKKDDGQGRDAERTASKLSFHCMRHTATSLLKNAGVSNVVAMEIIGHDSEAVSRIYTHIESDTLRQALNKLPDLVNELPPEMAKPKRRKTKAHDDHDGKTS